MPNPTLPPKTIELDPTHTAIVDANIYDFLSQHEWHAQRRQKSHYAYTNCQGDRRKPKLWMHRLIANTPSDQICHHRNRNSLDNRRANLRNMSRGDHDLTHKNNSLTIKFDEPATPPTTPAPL